jgi:hypothetical protein
VFVGKSRWFGEWFNHGLIGCGGFGEYLGEMALFADAFVVKTW